MAKIRAQSLMRSDRVSIIDRIAILSKLIWKYVPTLDIADVVKLAKDIAVTLDEIDYHNVDLNKLADDFFTLFPGHWKERTQFLLIVTKYWPSIMQEMAKNSVERILLKPKYRFSDFECCVDNIREQIDIAHITNRIHVLETSNLLTEVEFVARIISDNPDCAIAIVVPHKKIHDLLSCCLNAKGIDFTSYVDNKVSELPSDFLNEIDAAFEGITQSQRDKVVREVAAIADVPKHHKPVEIVGVGDIKFLRSDIIILTELNEDAQSCEDSGNYWFHRLLRHKANLPVSTNSTVEDLFYSCFCGDAEIYMLRAVKFSGSNKIKSPILVKFEAICKKQNRPLDYMKIERNDNDTDATIEKRANVSRFRIPHEIRVEDVGLLICDPQSFYIKNILNLRPTEFNEDKRERSRVLKNFMRACIRDDEQAPRWLEKIRVLDILLYYKCLNIMDWITSRPKGPQVLYGVRGETYIQNFDLTMRGSCDAIEIYGDEATLIDLNVSAPRSTKNITSGLEGIVTPLCYIAERGGLNGIDTPIRSVQIWSVGKQTFPGDTPIDVNEIRISSDLIAAFESALYGAINERYDY
ncbi:MAG: hypothetical protein LBJ42_01615 [Holosporales bacterium]|jgi:hypothetical protein|nr:hypothetical protein [Holosporales bacterium]